MFSAIGWLAALLTGFFTGLLSSFGLGGGTLLLLWLTFVTGIRAEVARGINLVYFLPVSAAALPAHARNGYLPGKALFWAIGAGMMAAGLLGLFVSNTHVIRMTPSQWWALSTCPWLLLSLSSSTCPDRDGSFRRTAAGRKSEWAGWKPACGPDETDIWCLPQSSWKGSPSSDACWGDAVDQDGK